MNPGDTVLHIPSGQHFLVACVRHDRVWGDGWPVKLVTVEECRVVLVGTEAQELDVLLRHARTAHVSHAGEHHGWCRDLLREKHPAVWIAEFGDAEEARIVDQLRNHEHRVRVWRSRLDKLTALRQRVRAS
jgi:hypothetical protein